MIVLKVLLSLFVLWIFPTILGFVLTRFTKEKNNIFLAFVVGYLLEFATFELLYVPMYFAKIPFQIVSYTWIACVSIVTLISLFINRKSWKDIGKATIEMIKTVPKMLTIVFLGCLVFQMLMSSWQIQNIDLDDSFYVATINTTIETNSLFQYNGYDGSEYTTAPLRYSLSGLVIYFATLSQILQIHPAILTHTIWPIIAIPLEFMVYALIASEIFQKNKEKIMYFLIFLSIIYIFGYVSVYMNFSYFAYRSSQGKALIGNLILPMIGLCYFHCIRNNKFADWFILFCTAIASCFTTELGVFLTPFMIGILAILDVTQNRRVSHLLKFGCCCLPQLVIGTLYLILI